MNTLFASKWLPETGATLTLWPKLTIPFKPLLFNGNTEKQKRPKLKKRDSIQKLLVRAEAFEATMKQKRLTKAQLARKKKTSRARITQIMNLLKLDSEIRGYIKNLKDPDQIKFFTERKLRAIATISNSKKQHVEFERLKKGMPYMH